MRHEQIIAAGAKIDCNKRDLDFLYMLKPNALRAHFNVLYITTYADFKYILKDE